MALLGVGLDDRPLLGGQRAGLQEDRVGDRHLADVVQRGRVAQALAELGVHADVLGQEDREAPDPLDVGAGVLVAELDCHREALNGLGLCDLELGEGSFQLAGAALDLVLEGSQAFLAQLAAGTQGADGQRRPRRRR